MNTLVNTFGHYSKKRYRFCSKEKDEETRRVRERLKQKIIGEQSGMYYYGARYYSPWLCRFISVDPLAGKYAQLTPYNYAGNEPIADKDIDGMQSVNTDTSQTSASTPANNLTPNSTAGTNINCHQVKAGETLGSIAKQHGTTVDALAKANNISDPNKIEVGQELDIPAKQATKTTTQSSKQLTPEQQSKLLPQPKQTFQSMIDSKWGLFASSLSYSRTSSTLVDPFKGKATITSNWLRSNGKKHGAYDFGVSIGTPIYNPANGQLAISSTTSEKNSKLNYGNYMVINHGVIKSGQYSGYTLYSLYGHLNTSNFSQSGLSIQAGQMIGTSGNTGSSTGPHLHWEIFVSKTNSVNLKDGVNFPNIGKTLIHPNQFLNLYYSTLRK